jgi:calcineurin-like phosphoesterase family protein
MRTHSTHLRQANQLVVVGHEHGNFISQPSEETVDIAVDLGDVDVGMAVL